MDSWNKFEAIKQMLAASPTFDLKVGNRRLIATRRRTFVPRRGAFRLLIPHTRAIVTDRAGRMPRYSVQPDPIAIGMVVILLGCVAIELFADPAKDPRQYPPEFIYGLAIFYVGALIIEMGYTWRQLRTIIDSIPN